MGIDEILGRKPEKKSGEGEYCRSLLGECTKQARKVLTGETDVYLRGKFKSKARFVRCPKCKLIDCLLRESAKDSFPSGTKCPRCGARQERLMK